MVLGHQRILRSLSVKLVCVQNQHRGFLARAELKLGMFSKVDQNPVTGSFGPVKPLNSGFCGWRLQLPRSTQHLGLT